jgi:hypothetical protein
MTKMMRSVVVSMCNSSSASAAFCFARFVRYTPTLANAQDWILFHRYGWTSVCTENLNPNIVVMKPAEDRL